MVRGQVRQYGSVPEPLSAATGTAVLAINGAGGKALRGLVARSVPLCLVRPCGGFSAGQATGIKIGRYSGVHVLAGRCLLEAPHAARFLPRKSQEVPSTALHRDSETSALSILFH